MDDRDWDEEGIGNSARHYCLLDRGRGDYLSRRTQRQKDRDRDRDRGRGRVEGETERKRQAEAERDMGRWGRGDQGFFHLLRQTCRPGQSPSVLAPA